MRGCLAALLLILVAAAPAAAAPLASPRPPVAVGPFTPAARAAPFAPQRPLFGFNDQSLNYKVAGPAEDAALSYRAGASVARITFDWRFAEPARDKYRFADYDRLYAEMGARGIRPVWIVLFSPPWSWEPSVRCDIRTEDCGFPPARAEDGQFREIVRMLVRRYPESAAVEIWNEPNLRQFWGSTPDPVRYTELLRAGYDAVKSVDASIPVIGGAIASLPASSARDTSLDSFLSGVYANGGGGAMDAISVHAYQLLAPYEDWIGKTLRDVRAVRTRYGDSARRIWVTEVGQTTTNADPQYRTSEERQAEVLVSTYRRLAAQPDVDAVIVHTLIDPVVRDTASEVGFGVLRSDLSAKPSFCALRTAVTGLPCP